MKKYITSVVSISLCFLVLMGFESLSFSDALNERIIFLKVNLACSAAPDIGCGSRSKPILLDLEKEDCIKEAWLNRAGNIVAVVWLENSEPQINLVSAVFSKHGISFEIIEESDYLEKFAHFQTEKWYKGSEVDQLSMEEAGRIASQLVDPLVEGGILTQENAARMFAEIEKFIQNEFITLKDVNLLNTTNYYDRWEEAITKIGEKYLGIGNMPELELCDPSSSSCKKNEKPNCCSKKTPKKCCSLPKSGS